MGESDKCCNPGNGDCFTGCCGDYSSPPESDEFHANDGGSTAEPEDEGCAENLNGGDSPEADVPQKREEELVLLRGRLRTKESQVEELLGRLQRLQADFDNFKRRTQKEKEDIIQNAAASTVETLLPVMDNFRRAFLAGGGEEASFREGVEMIFKQLEKTLKDAGLEPIECLGHVFDPNVHQAVFIVEDDSCEENTVVEEVQKGYTFGGRVIRPSMVKVSRKSMG